MRGRNRLIIAGSIVVVLLLAGWTFQNRLAAERAGKWIRVESKDLVVGIDVTGRLEALESDRLGPPQINRFWNYKISMMAPEGSDVEPGRPVLAFDTSELQQRLERLSSEAETAAKQIEKRRADLVLRREQTELELAEAEASLRKATLKLEAPPELSGEKERESIQLEHDLAVRQVQHLQQKLDSLEEAARAEIAGLENRRSTAAQRVEELQQNIRAMTVTAPRKGAVVYISDWNGEKKKVGDNAWRGEKIVEIPNLEKMHAIGEVDESDAGKVHVGQRVSFHLDAYPGEEFGGTIRSTGKTVQFRAPNDPQKVLQLDIELDHTDPDRMRPGMRLRGRVELERVKNAVVVPRDALFVDGGKLAAKRRGLLGVELIRVETGKRNDESIQVLSGLEPGDRILIPKEEGKKSG